MVTDCYGFIFEAFVSRKSCNICMGSRKATNSVFFLGVLLCVIAISVTSVNGSISTSRNLQIGNVATAGLRIPSNGGSRLRRPIFNREYFEFRKFLHQLKQQRQGARMISHTGITRRNIMLERSVLGNSIAKEIECSECKLKREWIPVSKPGCRTNYVFAPVCTGMCETWEIPDIHPPYVTRNHRVCRPRQIEYRKINLQRCNPGVNSQYVIAMAKSCACMMCKGTNTACKPL